MYSFANLLLLVSASFSLDTSSMTKGLKLELISEAKAEPIEFVINIIAIKIFADFIRKPLIGHKHYQQTSILVNVKLINQLSINAQYP